MEGTQKSTNNIGLEGQKRILEQAICPLSRALELLFASKKSEQLVNLKVYNGVYYDVAFKK